MAAGEAKAVNEYKALEKSAGIKEAKTRNATESMLDAQKSRDAQTFQLTQGSQLTQLSLQASAGLSESLGGPDVEAVKKEINTNPAMKKKLTDLATELKDPLLINSTYVNKLNNGIKKIIDEYLGKGTQAKGRLKVGTEILGSNPRKNYKETDIKKLVGEAILMSPEIKNTINNVLIYPFYKHGATFNTIITKLQGATTEVAKNNLLKDKAFKSDFVLWVQSNPYQEMTTNAGLLNATFQQYGLGGLEGSVRGEIVSRKTQEILNRHFLNECQLLDIKDPRNPDKVKKLKPIKVRDRDLGEIQPEEDDQRFLGANGFFDKLFKERVRNGEKLFDIRGRMAMAQNFGYPGMKNYGPSDYVAFKNKNIAPQVDPDGPSGFDERSQEVKQ